jgi:hypothetical protein
MTGPEQDLDSGPAPSWPQIIRGWIFWIGDLTIAVAVIAGAFYLYAAWDNWRLRRAQRKEVPITRASIHVARPRRLVPTHGWDDRMIRGELKLSCHPGIPDWPPRLLSLPVERIPSTDSEPGVAGGTWSRTAEGSTPFPRSQPY